MQNPETVKVAQRPDAVVERVETAFCTISPKTTWVFVRLTLSSGVTGCGEATFFGMESGIARKIDGYARSLQGVPVRGGMAWLEERMFRDFDELPRVALCGLGQALIDAHAREVGVAAVDLIGGARRDTIEVYANINRGTSDRSPDGWAARARQAVGTGFHAIKLAPFDGVRASDMDARTTRANVAAGIDAVIAVREAVGPAVRINVDFHGRFTEPAANDALRAMAVAAPHWIEMPVPETPGFIDAAKRLRRRAGDRGIRLAGAELAFGLGDLRKMIEVGAYDVYMPDLRFCGGVLEATRISAMVGRAGLEFSLHNPAGPLLDLVSLQVARACPAITMIEHQFLESDGAGTILDPPVARAVDGSVTPSDGVGWGAALSRAALERFDATLPEPTDFLGLPGAGNMS